MKTRRHDESAFTAFYGDSDAGKVGNPTPANAVALAIHDHKGFNSGSFVGEYVDALQKAQAQCEVHAELVDALQQMCNFADSIDDGGTLPDCYATARRLLAKVQP